MDFKRDSLIIKNVKGVYKIIYQGVGVSNNQYYSANNWGTRHGLKTKYSKIFTTLLLSCKDLPWMEEYQLLVFYNSKHDPSNVSGMSKIFEDNLKQNRKDGIAIRKGWVYDDSKKYCKGCAQYPDETLKPNTFEFVILHLK